MAAAKSLRKRQRVTGYSERRRFSSVLRELNRSVITEMFRQPSVAATSLSVPLPEQTSRIPIKEAAPPRWKRRPSSLVDASLNPFNRWSDNGIEASGLRHLGPSRPGVWLKSLLRAPQTVQTECRLAWRSVHCPPKDQPHNWVETVGAGARTVRLLLASAQVECRP